MMLGGIILFSEHLQNRLCVRWITCKYLVEVKQIYSLQKGPSGGNKPNEKRPFDFPTHHQQSYLFPEYGKGPVGFSFMRFNVKVLYFMRWNHNTVGCKNFERLFFQSVGKRHPPETFVSKREI